MCLICQDINVIITVVIVLKLQIMNKTEKHVHQTVHSYITGACIFYRHFGVIFYGKCVF